MKLVITGEEWRVVLGRARDVGAAMGAERVAVLAARAAVEALGVTVPVLPDELDDTGPPPPARRGSGAGDPVQADPPGQGEEPGEVERPGKDLRLAARTGAAADGYCPHCDTVWGAARLAVLDDGNRLCPVHGTVVRTVAETGEGTFAVARPPGVPRARGATAAVCGAPVGGHPCAEAPGHQGRHRPARREEDR